MLRISPNTEREYRGALGAEGLLVGDAGDLPELAVLQAALEKRRPMRLAPQQESSVERWAAEVKVMQVWRQARGNGPQVLVGVAARFTPGSLARRGREDARR